MTGQLFSSVNDPDNRMASADDTSPEHTEEGQGMAHPDSYDPGPSFVDDDRPTDRLTDMPAWLQTFAALETTRDENDEIANDEVATAPVHEEQHDAVLPSDDVVLPDWLQDSGDMHLTEPAGEEHTSSAPEFLASFEDDVEGADTASFISEDDLPDWLRAFSEESSVPPPVTHDAPNLNVTRAAPKTESAVAVRVPPVENIWLSSVERQALGPGGTLFALLASNANGALTHAPAGASAEASGATSSVATSQQPDTRGRSANGSEVEPARQSNSMRLLLLTLLIVLVVVLISFWQFS